MTDEIDSLVARLEEAAGKAGGGQWSAGHLADDGSSCNCPFIFDESHCGGVGKVFIDNGLSIADGGNDAPSVEEAKANLVHIATSHPANILSLCAAFKAVKGERDDFIEQIDAYKAGSAYFEAQAVMKRENAANARIAALEDGLRPFAKAGELFPSPVEQDGYDMLIYGPAAGKEYNICGDDLRRAARLLEPALKDCSPIVETTPQYVKDAVRGAQIAPDEIG